MNIFGIGPVLIIVGTLTGVALITLERLTGFTFSLSTPWRGWGLFTGVALLVAGMALWGSAGAQVKRAFGSHQLVTKGAFAICRNPMYAAIIVCIIPGIAFIVNDLMLIIVSVTTCIAFKLRIAWEEEFLSKEFGQEYEQYRESVAQLIPFIRL